MGPRLEAKPFPPILLSALPSPRHRNRILKPKRAENEVLTRPWHFAPLATIKLFSANRTRERGNSRYPLFKLDALQTFLSHRQSQVKGNGSFLPKTSSLFFPSRVSPGIPSADLLIPHRRATTPLTQSSGVCKQRRNLHPVTPWRDSPKLLFPHRKNVGGKAQLSNKNSNTPSPERKAFTIWYQRCARVCAV